MRQDAPLFEGLGGCGFAGCAVGRPSGNLHLAGGAFGAGSRRADRNGRPVGQAVLRQDMEHCRRPCCRPRRPSGAGFGEPLGRLRRWSRAGRSSCATSTCWMRPSQTAPADTQFFCSNASGTLTVTITMHALPPGRYAVVLADAVGAPLAGQLGIILAWDRPAWRLAGAFSAAGNLRRA